jgi:hypothetical protein
MTLDKPGFGALFGTNFNEILSRRGTETFIIGGPGRRRLWILADGGEQAKLRLPAPAEWVALTLPAPPGAAPNEWLLQEFCGYKHGWQRWLRCPQKGQNG